MEAKKKKALIAAVISRQLLLTTLMISKILESDNYSECLHLIKLIMLLLKLCSLSQLIIQLSQLIAPRLSICRSVVYEWSPANFIVHSIVT